MRLTLLERFRVRYSLGISRFFLGKPAEERNLVDATTGLGGSELVAIIRSGPGKPNQRKVGS